jgi:hypothetical protein
MITRLEPAFVPDMARLFGLMARPEGVTGSGFNIHGPAGAPASGPISGRWAVFAFS